MKKLLQNSSKLLVLLALYQTSAPAHAAKIPLKILNQNLSQAGASVQVNSNISGKVITTTGEALPGVTVIVKNTAIGTTTAADGTFQLSVPQPTDVLVFSFIGYTSKEVSLNNQNSLQVTLLEDAKALNEVVIVGYGQQDRKSLISAVSTVNAGEIKNKPVASFDQQLQGRAAGVQVAANTGVPGDGLFFRIRGTTSINASNDPLYVVDGVFINNQSLQKISTQGQSNNP